MSEALRSHYLEALGVPDFLHVQIQSEDMDTQKIATQCLVIETSNPHSFCLNGKPRDFLLKMLGAINLTEEDIHCISINVDDLSRTRSGYNAKTVLLMSEGLKPSSEQHFVAHHPSEILTNNQLKREVWEVLIEIKACLK